MQRSAKALTSLRIPYKAILTASTETRRGVFVLIAKWRHKQRKEHKNDNEIIHVFKHSDNNNYRVTMFCRLWQSV